jgi:hypothetical protein
VGSGQVNAFGTSHHSWWRTKSIETSIATRIDAVRRGFADTESIEPTSMPKVARRHIFGSDLL